MLGVIQPGDEIRDHLTRAVEDGCPVVAASVLLMARRWKMTRNKPTAVIAMISAAMISVAQAAAGMAVLLPQPRSFATEPA